MEKYLDKYSTTVVLLLIMAVMFIAIPLIRNFGDFISGVLVVAGVTCTILASFVIMFTGSEPVDPYLVGLLPVQGCLNLCRIASDTGITGNAYFFPPRITGESRVMQFNPESKYYAGMISAKQSFSEEEPGGLVTIPSSDPLIQSLRKRNALIIPDKVDELNVLISETISEVFEFAPHVSTVWENGKVTITMHEYRYIEGCRYARSESPDCCSRYPCPTCSLCGTLIVECIDKVVTLEECSISSQDITAVFSFD